MRRDWMAKLALGCAGVTTCGGLGGMVLANYVATDAFVFYRQAHVAEWRPEREPNRVALATDSLFSGYSAERSDSYLTAYRDSSGQEAGAAHALYER